MFKFLKVGILSLLVLGSLGHSNELDDQTKSAILSSFSNHLQGDLTRISPYIQEELEDLDKSVLQRAVKDVAFFDNLIFSIYESNKWFLLEDYGLDKDFKRIHEACRKFMYHNAEYSSVLKNGKRYKAFSFAEYLTGGTHGCLYHKSSNGRMKYRKEVKALKEILLVLMKDRNLLKNIKKANNQLAGEFGKQVSTWKWSPLDLIFPPANAGIKKALMTVPCAIGLVPIWLTSFTVLISLDYSILLPFTAYNLSKGIKGKTGTGGALSKDYTMRKAFDTCRGD